MASGAARQTTSQDRQAPLPLYVHLFLLALALNIFSGYSAYLGLPLSLDRPLFLASAVLLFLDASTERLRFRATHVVMISTVLWTGGSWLFTGSLGDSAKAFALTDRIVLPFLMFLLGPLIFNTSQRRDVLLKVLIVLSFYLAYLGIMQVAGRGDLVFPAYAGNPDVGINKGRGVGTFGASEAYGMAMCLTFFASGLGVWRFHRAWRVAAVGGAVLSFVGVVLCMTRSNWLSAVVGIVVAGLVIRKLRPYLPVAALAGAGLLALLPVILPDLSVKLADRLGTERSVYDRLNVNNAALRIIDEHPLFGIGWGQFFSQSADWVRQADLYPLTNTNIEIHNVFLSRAAETGVVGAVLWGLAVLLGPAAILLRRLSSAEAQAWRLFAALALIVWIFPTLGSPNPYPFGNNLLWLIAGIASRPISVELGARRARVGGARRG